MKNSWLQEVTYGTEILVIISATILIASLYSYLLKKYLQHAAIKLENSSTNYPFFRHITTAIIYIVGIGIALSRVPELKTLAHSLLAGAGILTIVTGIASQQALGNVVSGLFIVIFKPFKVNDKLSLRGTYTGVVEDISLRHTVIRDFENNRIIVPNAVISGEILVNSHLADASVCKFVDIGVSYSTNLKKALKVMQDEVKNHPLSIDVRTEEDIANKVPEVVARVTALGESSINLRVWAWAENSSDGFAMYCDLLESIKTKFDNEGIEIPFPQREVKLKK